MPKTPRVAPLRVTPLRRWLTASTLLLASIGAPLTRAALPWAVDGQPLPSLAPMLERVVPAVVNISTLTRIREEEHPLLRDPFFRRFFGFRERSRPSQSLGSGVIVDAARGLVLTNHHVIDKAEEVKVTLGDGRALTAEVLGADPETDVAVLRIPAEGLSAAALGDSDKLRVGDFVVAIGNPYGLSKTVTSGIVSALGRSGLEIERYEDFIQTDASINVGNSGGPLVNLRGELVGINTAILAPGGGNIGIGFAIPVNMARNVMDQIVTHGGVNRGVFGVSLQELTPQLAEALKLDSRDGALVAAVRPGSAAERAGLRAGDFVVRLNGRAVRSAADLHLRLALLRIGDEVRLDVVRGGRERRLTARVADPYEHYVRGEEISGFFRGALLGETLDDSPYGNLRAIAVGRVEKESDAWRNGLRPDDVLLAVNEERTEDLAGLRRIVRDGRPVWHLKLRRGAKIVSLVKR